MKKSDLLHVGLSALLCVLLMACSSLPASEESTPTPAPTPLPATPLPSQTEENPVGYINITPAELASMLEEKDFLLINTHAPYGFEIKGTDAHIPVDEGGRWLQAYPTDKTTKMVLYCRSAHWSSITARKLVAAGYTNVWHLEGGMFAWDAAGFPLVTQ